MDRGHASSADTLKSGVAFNNGIGKKTATQPADGVEVAYQITLKGGDLDGCAVDVVEQLYGRDEGAWGIFDIAGDVKCDRGGFSYTSSGAWDGKGFHAAGDVEDGSGSGDFEGISGRVAQLKGGGAPMPATAPTTSPTTWCSMRLKTDPLVAKSRAAPARWRRHLLASPSHSIRATWLCGETQRSAAGERRAMRGKRARRL